MEKGIQTSDYINFNSALNTGLKLLDNPKKKKIGLYILVSIFTGLKTGDIQKLTYEQFNSDSLTIQVGRTGKIRTIKINETMTKVFQKHRGNGLIFMSQKNSVFTTQSLNRILKKIFNKLSEYENISTHSLRKSFGRRVYDMNGQSEHSLGKLSEIFGHKCIHNTRVYLDLKQKDPNEIYMNL